MSLIRIAATAGAGLFLGLVPASAAPINPAGPQTIRPTPPSSKSTIGILQ